MPPILSLFSPSTCRPREYNICDATGCTPPAAGVNGPKSRTWQHLHRMAGSRSTLILQIPTTRKRTMTLIFLFAQQSVEPHGHA